MNFDLNFCNSHEPAAGCQVSGASLIRLRGHHVLCIQSYKGLGYSAEFVANMSALIARLQAEPTVRVRLSACPDDICRACPHLIAGGCHIEGNHAEHLRAALDRIVLRTLRLRDGDTLTWREIATRLEACRHLLPSGVCGLCRWSSTGHCEQSTGVATDR